MFAARLVRQFVVLAVFAGVVGAAAGGGTTPPPPAGPTITEFIAVSEGNDLFTFSGKIANPNGAQNLTIQFGGLPSLNGQTVAINGDGTFTLTIQLGGNEYGIATSTLVDRAGNVLDQRDELVQ